MTETVDTSPLYDIAGDIYTIDRDTTAFGYFQGNRDGTAKVKRELRYGRNLWTDPAQIRIRIPIVTKYPTTGNPSSGLGNIELGYSYNVKTLKFDHSLEIRAAFPTASNHVESLDTQLKGFYSIKWKWRRLGFSYVNEYDQTVIKPPGSSWTSYYEGKFTAPDYEFLPTTSGLKISGFYNYRVLFDSGGKFKDAVGATIFDNFGDVALSLVDSWGIGGNALWNFKFEANLTARF